MVLKTGHFPKTVSKIGWLVVLKALNNWSRVFKELRNAEGKHRNYTEGHFNAKEWDIGYRQTLLGRIHWGRKAVSCCTILDTSQRRLGPSRSRGLWSGHGLGNDANRNGQTGHGSWPLSTRRWTARASAVSGWSPDGAIGVAVDH